MSVGWPLYNITQCTEGETEESLGGGVGFGGGGGGGENERQNHNMFSDLQFD